jgi:tetratricopeptide (TPR) repeat protein/serine/threonine protein kinase
MNGPSPLEAVFFAALEKGSAQERAAYLAEACAGDEDLRRRVEKMLAAQAQAGSFLEQPALSRALTIDEQAVSERPGTVIGPYKLMEQIGEGGMGLVFVAEQQEPVRRKVALKVIKPGMDTRQVIARFEAERQALALMDHPQIAKVLDGGETTGGRPYFVMELVKGVPITDYCDQNQMAIRQRLELFVHVCEAVQHAHQKGIIHRDLKPSNVLVLSHDGRPVVKVIDFGVAKAIGQQLTDKTIYTQFAQLVGTPLYMAPEQAGESGLDVDTRSDVYALGVLLYELLTGTTPFDKERLKGASYEEMRRIIREEEPPKPSTRLSTGGQLATTISMQRSSDPRRLRQLVRGDLDWIVMKALEKDRGRRYETASAFAADVQRYLHDQPVQACPPSAWYRCRKFARRNKGALAVAGLIVVFLVFLGGAGLWWAQQRAGAAGEARAALAEASGLLEEERWPEALSAARRAEGVLAGVGAARDLRGQVQELIRDVKMADGLQEARLRGTAVKDGHFDFEARGAAYAAAFADYGLDVDRLDAQVAAEQIRSRSIHRQLVAALDDWARILKSLKRAGWRQRLAVARAADPDAWRNRLRDALEGRDPKALEEVAATDTAREWPVSTIQLLGDLALGTPSGERVAAVLVRAQPRHPGDFWINEMLGLLLEHARPPRLEEAIGYYTAAVALRPQSPGARLNLGTALIGKERIDQAIAELRQAIHFKNDYAEAHAELGRALIDKGRLNDALAQLREADRLKKNDALTHFWLGIALDKKRRLDEAIAEFREAIRLNKDFAEAHNGLGAALDTKGRLDEAIGAFREAIRLKKDFAEAHDNLGSSLREKGLLDDAIAECQKAIRLKRDFPEAHYNLGNALRDRGRLDEAIAAFREAMRLKKDYAKAHTGLGATFSAKGRWDEAIAEHREAIRLQKDFAEAHYNLGLDLEKKGDPDGAIAAYRQAIRLKKDFVQARDALGTALHHQGRLDEAIACYQKAIALDPKYAKAHCDLGIALKAKGRLDEAIAEYREALRIKPDFPEAYTNLGHALRAKGWWDEAIAAYRQALRTRERFPQAWIAHAHLGAALERKGRLDEAIAEYREAIRLKKGDAELHNNLGAALHKKRRLEEAIGAFREAIRLKKDLVQAHYNLGIVLSNIGLWDDAISEYREAIRLKKDDAETHYELGIALRHKGRLNEAIGEYREAIRLKKDYLEAHNNLGNVLSDMGLWDEAIAELREAIRLKRDFFPAHSNLGNALRGKGLLDEAIREYREAIRLKNDYAEAHNNLGVALHKKHRLDEAIGAFREAIRFKKDLVEAHNGLANVLSDKGKLDEAIREYREAIRLKKDYAQPHNGLGGALFTKGQLDGAIAEFHECLRIAPENANAHCNLGNALQQQGDFQRALHELRRGHELGSKNPRWGYPSGDWIRQCERLVELDGRLPGLLAGTSVPASPSERIELAEVCNLKKLNRAAVRFYERAFSGQPGLADDLSSFKRYNAACVAAQAAAGQGKDAGKLDSRERARLRRQALDWLRADLAQRIKQLDHGSPKVRSGMRSSLAHWQEDPDLASVRGAAALAKLPADEQPGWRQLWADVEKTLAKARQENKRPEKSTKKQ